MFSKNILFTFVITILLLLLTCAIIFFVLWKNSKSHLEASTFELALAKSQITNLQQNSRQVRKLDEKLTTELREAKNTINQLEYRVESDAERLRIAATCPSRMSIPTTSTRVADAASPELTRDAQRAYFSLRREILISEKMISGLQQYIREQCLR
ncbi:lysis protein [Enterobacter sp. ECC-175]|uniref:lysis protein n=1 Tax=unclassified Enterobacter TaxID=2608935 RepID=UPI0015ECD4E6|nr:lysis protein [Enterobacter sp. RIT 418]